jgi:chromosomal replication initiator protein
VHVTEQSQEGGQSDAMATWVAEAWGKVRGELSPEQRVWLTDSKPLTLHENTLMVAAPSEFHRERLQTRYRDDIEQVLAAYFTRPIKVAVLVDQSLAGGTEATDGQGSTDHVFDAGGGTRSTAGPASTDHTMTRTSDDRDGTPAAPGSGSESLPPETGSDPRPPAGPAETGTPGESQDRLSWLAPTTPSRDAYQQARRNSDARLNPKYSFESFVIGASNRFAHAAAVAVAESPGKAYNPLMIYGDSGLGKTHLLHALGHYVRNYFGHARLRYVSSEELTNDFINAITDNKTHQFRRRYRDVEVLLVDDIQFLEGKEQTQEEFFHTFNTLHNAQKQIVMTSDRPPKLLDSLEARLRSRFEWGLITDIQPPDLETRIAILRKKAAQERLTAGPEVLEFIASRIQTNIRELEGALIRVTAFASLNRQQVDVSIAETVLRDLIPDSGEAQITSGTIITQVASYFGLTVDDLSGQSRTHVLVTARQIAMYLCRELTDLSLPKVGQQFGGRDHTTVMHAERKVRTLMAERRSVFNQVTELTNRIKHQATRR